MNIDDSEQLDCEKDTIADQGVDIESEKRSLGQNPGHGHHGHHHGHQHGGCQHGRRKKGSRNWGILFFTMFMPIQAYILEYFWFFDLQLEDKGKKGFCYWANFGFMLFVGFMNFQTYYKCVFVRNTPIQKDAPPADKNLEDAYQNDKTCKSCNYWKPTRTSHCSSCDSCVMKLDHHCPWIDNCVGLKNHQAFLLFCTYMCLGAAQFAYHSVNYCAYLNKQKNFFAENHILFYVYWTIVGFIITPMTIMLGGLVCFHSFSLMSNMTTLQNIAGAPVACPLSKDQSPSEKNKNAYINIYDQGVIANIREFFVGDRFFFWCGKDNHPDNDGAYPLTNPDVYKTEFMVEQLGSDFPKDVFGRVDSQEIIEKFQNEMNTEKTKYIGKLFQFGPKVFQASANAQEAIQRQQMMMKIREQMMNQQQQLQSQMGNFETQEEFQAYMKEQQAKMMTMIQEQQKNFEQGITGDQQPEQQQKQLDEEESKVDLLGNDESKEQQAEIDLLGGDDEENKQQ